MTMVDVNFMIRSLLLFPFCVLLIGFRFSDDTGTAARRETATLLQLGRVEKLDGSRRLQYRYSIEYAVIRSEINHDREGIHTIRVIYKALCD